jgi:hypothetical protein
MMTADPAKSQRQTAYGTPEQIKAQRENEARTLRERHAWMLTNAADPILRALIEAHRPRNDDLFPDCAGVPRAGQRVQRRT